MEPSAATEIAKHTLQVFGIIIVDGLACGLLATRLRVPDVAVLLIAGMLLGPGGADLIRVRADSALNQMILIFGSSYILFDGGASLRLAVLKQTWITIGVIATIGVLITGAITADRKSTRLNSSH